MSLPIITTDATVEEIKEAANIDFNFIKNDLQDLQKSYSDSVTKTYINSVAKLFASINETYKEEMPKDTSRYSSLCLEGIIDDVIYMLGDLNTALAVCANMATSGQRLKENIEQFQIIVNSLGDFSTNLTNLTETCVVKIPKPSWERVQCIYGQVEVFADQFGQILNNLKTYNEEMSGHLMLLKIEMSNCYEAAFVKLSDIGNNIKIDLEFCKL